MERKSFKRPLTLLAFSMLLTMLLGISFPVKTQAASPGTWVRVCHNGYGDPVEIGGYSYYYNHEQGSPLFQVCRQDCQTGATQVILDFKPQYISVATFIYTNGKYLVYQDDIGYVYCKNADGTGKARKILDLHIYKTKNSFTTMIPYRNKIFYSTCSGYTTHYKIYSVNITGKANKKTISKSYNLEFPSTQVQDRYFYVSNKRNQAAVLDAKTGKIRKLNSSGTASTVTRIGNYWYYAVSTSPYASGTKITFYKKKASGSGSAKKLAAVSRKGYTLDSIQEITPTGAYYTNKTYYFLNFKTKSFKKTTRTFWYYVSKNAAYL